MAELKYFKKGEDGYKYFESLIALTKEHSCTKATADEDQKKGYDMTLVNAADQKVTALIDVKNTRKIIFLRLNTETKLISIRHPMKLNSEATHVAIVDVYNNVKKFYGVFTKQNWLAHFIQEDKIQLFLEELNSLDNQQYMKVRNSITVDQACFQIKELLLLYVKRGCTISYDDPKKGADGEIVFRLTSPNIDSMYQEVELTDEYLKNISANQPIKISTPLVGTKISREKTYNITI